MTPKSYLNQCLEADRSTTEDSVKTNDIRRCIKELFGGEKEIECHALTKPLDDSDQVLGLLSNLDYDGLKIEFRTAVDNLVQDLRDNYKVKEINGRPLTAPMILNLTLEYVEAINRKEKPVIESSFERVL
jgi:hypothetical protein